MSLSSLIHWVHIVSMVVWIGGLVFLTLVLAPPKKSMDVAQYQSFVSAALKFRAWMAVAIVFLLGSGGYRIMELGGMKYVPLVIHIKFAITLVMVALTLVGSYVLLPKVAQQLQTTTGTFEKPKKYCMMMSLYMGTLALGIVVLALLAQAGLL